MVNNMKRQMDRANHHLWNNHGTWFVCYTVYPTPLTKERRRKSLRTKSLEEACRRRDKLFTRQRSAGTVIAGSVSAAARA